MARRSAAKPECISAATERAMARARGCAGHSVFSCSAQYSAMARLSQMVSPSCSSTGTSPAGVWSSSTGVPAAPSGMTTVSTSSRASVTASQPRIDQEE